MRRLTIASIGICVLGIVALALFATDAAAHRGGSGITRGGAQENLVETTLHPHGSYYGVAIRAKRADCRGDFDSPTWLSNNQRYFNHLFCTLADQNGRTWRLTYHQTSRLNWQYSNLREGTTEEAGSFHEITALRVRPGTSRA